MKKIFNIGVIACIAAMLLYFLQTPVPSFLQAFITNLGNLTAPLSMMIIGASLAQMPLKELFLDKKLLLFSLVKLLLLPAVWMIMVNRVAEQEILRGGVPCDDGDSGGKYDCNACSAVWWRL